MDVLSMPSRRPKSRTRENIFQTAAACPDPSGVPKFTSRDEFELTANINGDFDTQTSKSPSRMPSATLRDPARRVGTVMMEQGPIEQRLFIGCRAPK